MVWFLFSYLKMKAGTARRQYAGLQIRTEQDMI